MKQCPEQMSLFSAEASLDHASRSVLPGSEEARKMTVTSGLKCLELYQNSGPLGLLVRTLLGSSIWRSTKCTLTWKTKVTPSKRLLFRLVPSTPRTGVTEYVSWAGNDRRAIYFIPTPRAQNIRTSEKAKRESKSSPGLVDYVEMWPTPKASDCKGTGPLGSKSAYHDLNKNNLKGVVMFYPTPTTGAGLCGGTGNFQQLKKLKDSGQITEEERRNMSQGNGGQLNPDWVEWLMGFPVGWTSLQSQELQPAFQTDQTG